MQQFLRTVTWTQYFTMFLVIPTLIGMQICSWLNIHHHTLYIAYTESLFPDTPIYHDATTLSTLGKICFSLIESIPTMLLLWALWHFIGITRLYQRGQQFSQEILLTCKKILRILLAWAIYNVFLSTLASIVISIFKPAGQRYITLAFSQRDIFNFFGVLLLCIIFQMLYDAHKLKKEVDLTV